MTTSDPIARTLLEIGAVTLRTDPPFTWASGRLAPIYCDNRLLMSYPEGRRLVTEAFAARISEAGWEPRVVAGTATAGIPHAAWLAHLLDLPMVYVRGAAKGHGKENRVEGRLERGAPAVLVEDLVSTGGSSLDAAGALAEAGADLRGVTAIFTYGLDVAARRFEEAELELIALTDLGSMLAEAESSGRLGSGERAILESWRRDPAAWSLERGGAS